MDLTFSWFADAGAWPEHPGAAEAALDQEVVGPLGLLDHVETMLGLGRPEVTPVRRIAVYLRKIEAAGPGRFWSDSFKTDPWSAAREILGWRDELVEAGWRPDVGLSRKNSPIWRRRKGLARTFRRPAPIACAPRSRRFARPPSFHCAPSRWSTPVRRCPLVGVPCSTNWNGVGR